MSIEAGMAAKGLAALAVVGGGAVGAYYAFKPGATAQTEDHSLSKYDRTLINFLDGNTHDIIFDVKKVGENNAESAFNSTDPLLGNSVPASTTVVAKVRVTVPATPPAENIQLKVGPAAANADQIKTITDATSGAPWTWTCTITFAKAEAAGNHPIKEDLRGRILGTGDKGLFGILQKDINSYSDAGATTDQWTKSGLKEEKKNFISRCAHARGEDNNKLLDEQGINAANAPIASKSFTFSNEAVDTPSNLVPANTSDFDSWFGRIYGTNTYVSAG